MYVKVHSLASRNKIALFGVVLSLDQAITKKKLKSLLDTCLILYLGSIAYQNPLTICSMALLVAEYLKALEHCVT